MSNDVLEHSKLLKVAAGVVVVVVEQLSALNLPAIDLCQVEVGCRMPNLGRVDGMMVDILHWLTTNLITMTFLVEAQRNLPLGWWMVLKNCHLLNCYLAVL